jgi:hypothetical protein
MAPVEENLGVKRWAPVAVGGNENDDEFGCFESFGIELGEVEN